MTLGLCSVPEKASLEWHLLLRSLGICPSNMHCTLLAVAGTACKAFSVADRLPNGTVDLILAYCHNSLNDNSLQEWVPYLKEQGVAIISASPMSMGLMTTKVCCCTCCMILHNGIV